jgi:hypothetical protein
MIVHIQDDNEEGFLRHWSERVYDQIQLAQIAAIEAKLVEYALTAWRPISIDPPRAVLLLCACEDGLQLMTLMQGNEWRTRDGLPHKPPLGWMPAPSLPKGNGRAR